MSNKLEFTLGLKDAGFTDTLSKGSSELGGFMNKTEMINQAMAGMQHEMIGTREKTEILRQSLYSMGGSMGALGDLARMALDPMTIGFAAVFAAVEFFNRGVEEANQEMQRFFSLAKGGEDILRGIFAARPTHMDEFVRMEEVMGKLSEKFVDLTTVAEAFNATQKDIQANSSEAAQKSLDLEIEKINLLRAQSQISEADAAKRIAALKNQALLQKDLTDRNSLKNEIAARQAELSRVAGLAARSPSLVAATNQKDSADSNVADLKKQLTDLPKVIAENKKSIDYANAMAKGSKSISTKAEWYDKARFLTAENGHLQTAFDAAKAQFPGAVKKASNADESLENAKTYKNRMTELGKMIPTLQNKLGSTIDRQRKVTPLEVAQNNLAALESQASAMKSGAYKPAATSLEKMGFVMGGKSAGDQNKEIADNTRRTNALLTQIAGLLKFSNGGGGEDNGGHQL